MDKNTNPSKQSSTAKSLAAPNSDINFAIQKRETLSQNTNQTTPLRENKTGIPDNLKSSIEHLSCLDMSDVKVHYNSSQPAQLNAHAYAQGNQIHIASGQEKHLPHEAWHVVQQKQGRVKPTKQLKGKVNINDDLVLEKEADVMGAIALGVTVGKSFSGTLEGSKKSNQTMQMHPNISPIQFVLADFPNPNWFNVVGEDHDISEPVRAQEIALLNSIGFRNYFTESKLQVNEEDIDPEYNGQFGGSKDTAKRHDSADPSAERVLWFWKTELHEDLINSFKNIYTDTNLREIRKRIFNGKLHSLAYELFNLESSISLSVGASKTVLSTGIRTAIDNIYFLTRTPISKGDENYISAKARIRSIQKFLSDLVPFGWNTLGLQVGMVTSQKKRSIAMNKNAQRFGAAGKKGIWKVGDDHVNDIEKMTETNPSENPHNAYLLIFAQNFYPLFRGNLINPNTLNAYVESKELFEALIGYWVRVYRGQSPIKALNSMLTITDKRLLGKNTDIFSKLNSVDQDIFMSWAEENNSNTSDQTDTESAIDL